MGVKLAAVFRCTETKCIMKVEFLILFFVISKVCFFMKSLQMEV